jgi:hypothetical protein
MAALINEKDILESRSTDSSSLKISKWIECLQSRLYHLFTTATRLASKHNKVAMSSVHVTSIWL